MNPIALITSVSLYNAFVAAFLIAVPVFLFALYLDLRLTHKRVKFLNKIEWITLKIKPPKEIIKTPKSMEQVFASLYGIYSFGIAWPEKYLDGKVNTWISLEMVGHTEGIEFYVRCPKGNRNLVESTIYAQYPESEIVEVMDYTQQFPKHLPNDTYDLWGTGFTFVKDTAYPIRTYEHFEEMKEEKRTDSLAPLFEAMSKLTGDQQAWIQVIISPTGAQSGPDFDLKKRGEALIKKIMEEKAGTDEQGKQFAMFRLTPADNDIIKAIANKCSKLAFQASVRFVYIDRKETFNALNWSAIMGCFQQFNTQNMNALRPDMFVTVYAHWIGRVFPWYKKYRVLAKKRILYDTYTKRKFGYSNRLASEDLPMFSTEELATLYHFPSLVAKAPKLQPVSSRRGEAPVNLPTEK